MGGAPYKSAKGGNAFLSVSAFNHEGAPMYAYSNSLPNKFAEVLDKQ